LRGDGGELGKNKGLERRRAKVSGAGLVTFLPASHNPVTGRKKGREAHSKVVVKRDVTLVCGISIIGV